ncbi:hypothetical protein [Haloarchaeobius sp. HME9146]|uniref:hypothetical protein n=1 Tax=Haloarchaeobius sp. HME9146 TaxID=2978732 RepID=UPI0021BF2FAB|nr:hypothetical protein [Haloarchaeobius sp. HME9146]MCT9095198.1 hypothetical protein [Haloarchaeobius sp. HME9146]
MQPGRLELRLEREFGGQAHVVVREAVDLHDSGQYRRDAGHELTSDVIVDNLRDAPEGDVVERWNWWLGSLALAYGDEYQYFTVRRSQRENGTF